MAHGEALRIRVIKAVVEDGLSRNEAARIFRVGIAERDSLGERVRGDAPHRFPASGSRTRTSRLRPRHVAPKRAQAYEPEVLVKEELLFRGHPEVVDADLADYFGSIPHAELMKSVIGQARLGHRAVEEEHQARGRNSPSVLKPHRNWLLELRRKENDLTLDAITERLLRTHGVEADKSMLSRFLLLRGSASKKTVLRSRQDRPDVADARAVGEAYSRGSRVGG